MPGVEQRGENGNLNFNLIKFTLKFPVIIIPWVYFFSLWFIKVIKVYYFLFSLIFRVASLRGPTRFLRGSRRARTSNSFFVRFCCLSIPTCNIFTPIAEERVSTASSGVFSVNLWYDRVNFSLLTARKQIPLNPSQKTLPSQKQILSKHFTFNFSTALEWN